MRCLACRSPTSMRAYPCRTGGTRPCAYLLLSGEAYGESAADARARGWPVAEIPGVQHLAMATKPIPVTDALLELERGLA
jgi:hypothetical protein